MSAKFQYFQENPHGLQISAWQQIKKALSNNTKI